MPEKELLEIAANADMIVNGYAFTKRSEGYAILNLADSEHAMLISPNGIVLETNMTPIEVALVLSYWNKNRFLLEEENA